MSDTRPFFERLRERKLIQWAIAYLAGAWLLLELTSFAGESFGWPGSINRVLLVLFAFGLLATLVLAWYHGEKGRQRVSGPELFILAALLATAGGALTLVGSVGGSEDDAVSPIETILATEPDTRPGLAVLPFETRAETDEDRWFTEGLHDELLTRLQEISGLRVIDSESVRAYADSSVDIREIGTALRVGYALRGAVQRSGDRVRANFRLIDAERREQLWTGSYADTATPDALADIQVTVAQALAAQLRVAIREEESERLQRRSTTDPEAWELFLRSRAHTPELSSAERRHWQNRLLTQAVARDPGFAAAHSNLTINHAALYWVHGDRTEERAGLALHHLSRVQELEPGSDRAHMAAGWYHYWVARDFNRALEEIRQVRDELGKWRSPLQLRASVERRLGNFENSLRYGVQAAQLDPNSAATAEFASTLFILGRYDEAEEALRQTLGQFPEQRDTKYWLALLLFSRDRDFDGARRVFPSPREPRLDRLLEFQERDWTALRRTLDQGPDIWESQVEYQPRSLWRAWMATAQDDAAAARVHFEEAVRLLDSAVVVGEPDDRRHRALGLAYAGLGRQAEAIQHGARALELLSPERDAFTGPYNLLGMAMIHAALGNHEVALDYLEDYFVLPHFRSARWVGGDPRFDPIREDPRFDEIIQRYWPRGATR